MAEPAYQHLRSSTQKDVLVLTMTDSRIQGDVLADALRDELLHAVKESGLKKIVLDLRPVSYISSAAFRPLLSLRRHLQETGGRFVLCNLSPHVADVFEVTRLISTSQSTPAPFETAADVPAAIACLHQAAPS